ncbi:hypothetical protein [Actinomadura macrotermitis]|uniref:Uncharacterized protein n=1 Tax=Actinomadura macrotermitis TaxID=2585200 RepID=A0A7K0BRM0_9ACTN|nr:hypothetical protein [Actinomadura macrotermitis]MQY03845.1 hypothetical protein [Actinomadura macrotermitis]
MARDRGEGPVAYLASLLFCAVLAAVLLLTGLGGDVARFTGAAICRVGQAAGLVAHCDPPGRPGTDRTAPDPDQPVQPCLAGSESTYLEETVTIPTKRVDVRTNSRGTIQLNKRVGPDGRPVWEVVDFTWGEGGVSTPEVGKGPVKGGVWGGLMMTNGKVYGGFTTEEEARRFFDDLKEHRIGSEVKFTLRTNPVTGGFVWLGSKLPWVGDDIDRYMGGSEPDRKPTGEYLDGGITGGLKGDVELGPVKIPLKGRGWLISGTQHNLVNGEKTTYYTQRGEAEVAVQLDLGDIISKLPPPLRRSAQQGLEAGLDAVLNVVEGQLKSKIGNNFVLQPGQRAQIKGAVKLNPSIGLNYKHRAGTTWGVTQDKDGKVVRVTQTQNGQDVLYARVDGKLKSSNSVGDKFDATGGKQWILFAQRTLTEKALDYSRADDRKLIDQYLLDGDTDALERAWDQGAGTMGRTTYDNTGETGKAEAKGAAGGKPKTRWGIFEIGREDEKSILQDAQYFKPGVGWVPWKACR